MIRLVLLLALMLSPQAPPEALLGVTDMEELNEEAAEKLDFLERHPLKVNYATEARMAASGLMSRYQAASLADYRSRHGDVLSVAELAAVDGFGPAVAEAMRPYLSFESSRLPGQADEPAGLSHEIELRAGTKFPRTTIAGRYRLEYGSRIEAAVSYRDRLNGYASVSGRRWKAVAGCFNARFGQGLALWSGMSIGGVTTPEAAGRRASGIAPTWTFSDAGFRGLAGEYAVGKLRMSAFLDARGRVSPGGNILWLMKNGELGLTATRSKASADFRLTLRGSDLFGEAAYDCRDHVIAGIVGTAFPLWERGRAAVVFRHYPTGFDGKDSGAMRSSTKVTDETGVFAALRLGSILTSADALVHPGTGRRQLKLLLLHEWKISPSVTLKTRATERLRDYDRRTRTDVRTDLGITRGSMVMNFRLNALKCREIGFAGYAEAGYKREKSALWLRWTAFKVDKWDDRIYVYERDAPGNFSVPACYGSGFTFSLYGSWKIRRLRLYLKSGTTFKERSGTRSLSSDLHFQLSYSL